MYLQSCIYNFDYEILLKKTLFNNGIMIIYSKYFDNGFDKFNIKNGLKYHI